MLISSTYNKKSNIDKKIISLKSDVSEVYLTPRNQLYKLRNIDIAYQSILHILDEL